MLINNEKYKKNEKKKYMNSTVMYCSSTNKPIISSFFRSKYVHTNVSAVCIPGKHSTPLQTWNQPETLSG